MSEIDLGKKESDLTEVLKRLNELGLSLGEQAEIMNKLGLEQEASKNEVLDTER